MRDWISIQKSNVRADLSTLMDSLMKGNFDMRIHINGTELMNSTCGFNRTAPGGNDTFAPRQ